MKAAVAECLTDKRLEMKAPPLAYTVSAVTIIIKSRRKQCAVDLSAVFLGVVDT